MKNEDYTILLFIFTFVIGLAFDFIFATFLTMWFLIGLVYRFIKLKEYQLKKEGKL